MANITRNFVAGKMNKVIDERLVPNGEYVDALNIRMGSTENSEIGVIENVKGNLPLTSLRYINGTALSSSARCIGAIDDSEFETIYWFVHDPVFPLSVGVTKKLDMIVSYNMTSSTLQYHVISIDDGGGINTTLNFNPSYLITGVSLVRTGNTNENLLFFTDDYNQPRFINTLRNYPNPIGNVDQFSAESILVIKKPPVESPTISTYFSPTSENFMDDRFLCFAYRYRYEDGEYSATSQFSNPAFLPGPFDFDLNSFQNIGMQNTDNAVEVTYNTGGPLVKGIDLLFKDMNSNVIKVIEKLDKQVLGLPDNTNETYTFSNSKIYTILPIAELLRLYDNVPLLAKAQTIMGNRLMYGNYVEGYDLISNQGQPVQFTYFPTLITEEIGIEQLSEGSYSGQYTIDSAVTVSDSVAFVDLPGVQLNQGGALSISIGITHSQFTGPGSTGGQQTTNISFSFEFVLPNSYSSVYAMATSPEFQEKIGTITNIQTVPNACNGNTWTDIFNCNLPQNLGSYDKISSGIAASGQPIGILTYPTNNSIGFQLPAMRYEDPTNPSDYVYEYYEVTSISATFQKTATTSSLHSNRGYEVGIVYMDEYNRSSTVLVSQDNTMYIPCANSITKNSIRITIPITQKPPVWATRYKFVIKPDKENYETIYSSIFFRDPETGSTYFLLEGENSQKVEAGDRLIVKADTSGARLFCTYTTVLEKESKPQDFINVPNPSNLSVNLTIPSGPYMKINANNFNAVFDPASIISNREYVEENGDISQSRYPILVFPCYYLDSNGNPVNYDIPAGSRIRLFFRFQRLGRGDGSGSCERRIYELDITLAASTDYADFKAWWDGDNVEYVLDSGFQDVGGNNCAISNDYSPILLTGTQTVYPALCTNKYQFKQFSGGDLNLVISGTAACTGVLNKNERKSSIEVAIDVFRADSLLVFETEPLEANPDIFYENNMSFPIVNGFHQGNVQNQTGAVPALVDTEFFNCYCFGNGAESYKIRDSIFGKTLTLGNRVMAVAAQDYKEADRFADITYSGVFNDESNVNKLNEFNLGLLNFKPLEDIFGPIQILDGRETDVLVLQEDKISYVLAGKNLLSDSTGGGAVASVPEVLGTQIARVEKYGISFNPESYVNWGYDRYFTDVKRGVVINLYGESAGNDRLTVVSEMGMRTWFRDEFINSFGTQKLGGFDPYMNEYVLTINDRDIPVPSLCLDCGISQTYNFNLGVGLSRSYCVNVGEYVGQFAVTYNVIGVVEPFETFNVSVIYDGVTTSTGPTNASGSLLVNKGSNSVDVADVIITSTASLVLSVTVECPVQQTITVVQVVVTSGSDSGLTIHPQYRYEDGAYLGPTQSSFVTFANPTGPFAISKYTATTGGQGSGNIPTDGSTVFMVSNKLFGDTFDFDVLSDSFRYFRDNTLYNNNIADIQTLLGIANTATPIVASSASEFYATFNAGGPGDYLYLIWDFRNANAVTLCYSNVDETDVCCNC
jgi:hypothetical protein